MLDEKPKTSTHAQQLLSFYSSSTAPDILVRFPKHARNGSHHVLPESRRITSTLCL